MPRCTAARAKQGRTIIGSDCFLMAYSHVAHDCGSGDNVIMANAAMLAGHCRGRGLGHYRRAVTRSTSSSGSAARDGRRRLACSAKMCPLCARRRQPLGLRRAQFHRPPPARILARSDRRRLTGRTISCTSSKLNVSQARGRRSKRMATSWPSGKCKMLWNSSRKASGASSALRA